MTTDVDANALDPAPLVKAYRLIGERVPPGAITWAFTTRPDLKASVDAAEAEVDAAYDAGDGAAFSVAATLLLHQYVLIAIEFAAHESAKKGEVAECLP